MSVQAYILVQTEMGAAATVRSTIAALPGVVTAEDVTGPYDIIVRAEAVGMDEFGREVLSAIQQIGGITRTLTCPVVHL
jgi:DNA-binding Lrp family transcriptional regulator